MRRTIYTKQVGLRLTRQDHQAIRAARRPDEQLSDTLRRLLRVGMIGSETPVKSPVNPPVPFEG